MSGAGKTIAFIGASAGCGLHTLHYAINAGYTCIALCRTPGKLEAIFPNKPHNLIIAKGNAHDIAAVTPCLLNPNDPTRFVDSVNFAIGARPDPKNPLKFADPDVCKNGMSTLLQALKTLRADLGTEGEPLLSIISTTGISKFQRDVKLAFLPMYKYGLKVPHADKEVMEAMVAASGERYVLVRPSFLTDKNENEAKGKPLCPIKVGIEDLERGVEKKELGYLISRQEVARWMFENLLDKDEVVPEYQNKAVSITW